METTWWNPSKVEIKLSMLKEINCVVPWWHSISMAPYWYLRIAHVSKGPCQDCFVASSEAKRLFKSWENFVQLCYEKSHWIWLNLIEYHEIPWNPIDLMIRPHFSFHSHEIHRTAPRVLLSLAPGYTGAETSSRARKPTPPARWYGHGPTSDGHVGLSPHWLTNRDAHGRFIEHEWGYYFFF